MSIREFIEDLRAWWWYVCEGQFPQDLVDEKVEEVPGTLRPIKREKLDTTSMNLYIGKVIDDGNVKCEVVSCEGEDFRIKILDIQWDRLGTYMDLGNTYNLLLCSDFNDFKVWEVDPEQMKRTASQVLLAWQGGSGWYWDLDS